jgi:hypothetical protein
MQSCAFIEKYAKKMIKVKPTPSRLRTVHECRLLIHAFYKLMNESLTITSSSDDESDLEAVAAPRLVWIPREGRQTSNKGNHEVRVSGQPKE